MKKKFTTKQIVIGIIFVTLIVLGGLVDQLGRRVSKLQVQDINLETRRPSVNPETKKYIDTQNGFSFAYPASFSISTFGSAYDATGETILLQDATGKDGVQILVIEFDEDIDVLTEERIHRDVPDMIMSDVQTRTLGVEGKKTRAVLFTDENSSMGKSREAWFVHEKRLYQISAPENAKDIIMHILDSWKF